METAQKRVTADRSRVAFEEYQIGLAFFDKKQWKTAARHFGQADRKSHRHDENYHLYTSCHGLALVYCGDVSGLNRAPQGRVPGNAWGARAYGKCHRKYTAKAFVRVAGKGEMVR